MSPEFQLKKHLSDKKQKKKVAEEKNLRYII